jgi:dihydrofolate reductase
VRRVVVYELLSLDGVAEAPETFFGWDDALDAGLAEAIATQDDVVLGRRTWDEWVAFWPGSDLAPFASFINRVPIHVATSRPLHAEWRGSAVIDGDAVAFVRTLREGDGGDIGVHGSLSIVQALLAAGLVDELRLVIGPMLAPGGRRLLDGVPALQLELLHTERTPGGYLVADYRVARDPA